MATTPAQGDRRWIGAAWMLGAAGLGALIDAFVKALQDGYGTPQIVLLRLLFALPFVLGGAALAGNLRDVRPRRWRWHVLRACCASGTTFGFFWALGELPLVLAVTLYFAAPLLIAALSRPVLGEPVGLVRWGGIVLGFAGVLLALRPGETGWHPAMLVVLASATCWALLALSGRRMADEPAGAMVLSTMPLSLVISAVLALPAWVTPTAVDLLRFALVGLCGTGVHYCVLYAYRAADAGTVAPMEYSGLLWAAVLGFLFWGEIPTGWTLAGAAVIVAGGVIVLRARG
jgi:drug/metabolite transporter (DMT)-like permease